MPVPLFATSLAPYMDRIAERMAEVARSGRYILGPEVEAFEREFADFCGARHCVGVGNGTDAITIALRAMGVGPGDEVVVPSFTFYASVEATVNAGATPVFCDIDPVTFCVTREAVEAAVTEKTKAIAPGRQCRTMFLKAGRKMVIANSGKDSCPAPMLKSSCTTLPRPETLPLIAQP